MSDTAEILEQAARWREAGKGVALATVVSLATVTMSVAAGLAFRRPFLGNFLPLLKLAISRRNL